MMEQEIVEEFAEAIEQRFGHQQDARRMADLAALLKERMRLTGAAEYSQYRVLLERGGTEWEALAPLLTVPETYFFRMPDHFEALAVNALPRVLERNAKTRMLRMLSAGCASGEEAYTLRMVLNERFPQLRDWKVTIVGVDLSETALARARTGVYSEWSLRATSEARRRANFTAVGKQFQLNAEARVGVEFRQENLLEDTPPREPAYDVIFCRNVLIYFSEASIREAIARLTARLAPQGYLFLGPAESLRGISREFQLCHAKETFFYRRKEDSVLEAMPSRVAGRLRTGTATAACEESWFDSIRSSSERLAGLVTGPVSAAPASGRYRTAPTVVAAAKPAPAAPLAGFVELVKREQFAQALKLLDEGKEAGRGTEGVRLLRAVMLTNLGRHTEAEAECRELLKENELNAGAHFLLGLCREGEGDLQRAAEQMSAATYLDPGFSMAHLRRGLIARRRGERAVATTAFEHALKAVEIEDAERLALFGGGFSREGLRGICERELARLGATAAGSPAGGRGLSA